MVEEDEQRNLLPIAEHEMLENQKSRFRDAYGSGQYGSGRIKSDGSKSYSHQGLDVISDPNENIYSPMEGTIERKVFPYKNDTSLEGIEIIGSGKYNSYKVRVFYLEGNISGTVRPGQVIGTAQDLTQKYPNITNHVHIEVRYFDALIDPHEFFQMSF